MRLVIAIALVLCCGASIARADGMRCGERLVKIGDTTGEVAIKCGPPSWRSSSGECEEIETWTYDLGPQDFVRILTFVDGRLREIEAGEYGS